MNLLAWSKSLARVLYILILVSAPVFAADPFFFIQFSDPQLGMFATNANFVQETANFEFAVATVNRLRPAFVVITGDLVNKGGDGAQIAEYRRIVGKIDSSIPVYAMAGNHDVENVPTPATVSAYTNVFGPDHYTFRYQNFAGVVLDSSVIHSPQKTEEQFREQETWLRSSLESLRKEGVEHIVVFQHHPWFLKAPDEADEYFNIPKARRVKYLALFEEFGIKYTFSGHYHRNAVAKTDKMEAITTGPVGKPMGNDKSGMRIAIVRDQGIEHKYYDFGDLPSRIDLNKPPK